MRSVRFGPSTPFALLVVVLALLAGCTAPSAQGQVALGMQPPADADAAAVRDRPAVEPTTDPWVCPSEPLAPRFEPTLFVAPDGSDSNDGRSEGAPFATLQAAADVAGPGDVVWVREGVYSSDVELTTSGTESEPIVFESYPGECAILDGSSAADGRRVTFDGVEHVVFRNFVVRNSPAEGVYLIDANDNVLSNLELRDNYYSGITNVNGDRNLFTYVLSHGNADRDGGDADGISISSGDRNHVAHCATFDNSDDGVDTWRSTDTLVERCIAFRNGEEGGNGVGFKAGGDRPSRGTVVRESIAFENRSHGFDYNGGRDVAFERNTAYGNGGYGFVATGAELRRNLALANEEGPWYGERRGAESRANSWQSDLGEDALGSLEPGISGFLAPTDAAFGDGGPIGALAPGDTIADVFRIDLADLLAR